MWPRQGMRVEVKGVEDGFLGSWFGARILKALKGECEVQYDEFVDDNDESKPLQGTVSNSHLRPVPPSLNVTSWLNKEAVEVYYSHCWWAGIIQRYLPFKNEYVVYFRESMEELEIDASKIRTRQDWVKPADQRDCVWQIHTSLTGDLEAIFKTVEAIPECNTPLRETQGSSSLLYKSPESEDFLGTKRCKKDQGVVKKAAAKKSQQTHNRRRFKQSTTAKCLYMREEPFQRASPVSAEQSLQEPFWPSPVNGTPNRVSNLHVAMAGTMDLSFPIPSPSTPGVFREVKTPGTWKQLQRKAYQGVLAAFHAQSDTLTFPQEFLLTDLRKMLNIGQCDSDELLKQVMEHIEDP